MFHFLFLAQLMLKFYIYVPFLSSRLPFFSTPDLAYGAEKTTCFSDIFVVLNHFPSTFKAVPKYLNLAKSF